MSTAGRNISSAKGKPQKKRRINVERRAQIGEERRARTRAAVLDAAFSLLGRERGRNTRIEEICEAASISRGTFYNYFNSMDEVFDALSYEISHEFNVAVTEIVSQMPSAAERAGAAVRYYLERALKDKKWAWAIVNISSGGPLLGHDTFSYAQNTAQEGIASGEFDLVGPISGRDIVLGGTLAGMITQLKNSPSPTYPMSMARAILLGMGVPPGRVEEIVHMPLPDPTPVMQRVASRPAS